MTEDALSPVRSKSPIARIAWVLAGAIGCFAAENLWIDGWITSKSHHRIPSLVPEALSASWFLVLCVLAIALTLLVLCQILLMKDAGTTTRTKALTGIAVLAAALLAGEWALATGGTSIGELLPHFKHRKVILHWQASTTKNVRYNVYRGTAPGTHDKKLTEKSIDALTYTDKDVKSGTTYCYVARSVDSRGESIDSNEACVTVP